MSYNHCKCVDYKIDVVGAVKITPAHDHNDYEVGKRHNLPFLTIINEDGIIVSDCEQFNVCRTF